MKMKMLLTVTYLSSFFLLPGLAQADPITFQFSGNVTDVADGGIGITSSDAILGTFNFDPSTADLVPDDPTTGVYQFSAPFGMDVVAGGHDFSADGLLSNRNGVLRQSDTSHECSE
jgi:hypothetical protein